MKDAVTKRISSYDVSGRNIDNWLIKSGETKVLAEIDGPGCITRIWMTQRGEGEKPFLLREVVLKVYWDGEKNPSINVPLGDFFCLGHSLVNSFCSLPFSASTRWPYKFDGRCALNCYLQMPFRRHARIEVVNEGGPDLHGTGSEDYFNQAWGMQDNAFLFNGSSIFEGKTRMDGDYGGYQTSYVFHLTNPVHFKKSIKVTIEHGYGNHTANDYSSTAYWYQIEPHKKFDILPVEKRLPILSEFNNKKSLQTPRRKIIITPEMQRMKKKVKG